MKVQFKVAGMLAVLFVAAVVALTPWTKSKRGGNRQDYGNGEARWHGSSHEGHRHVEGPVLREVSRQQPGVSWNW